MGRGAKNRINGVEIGDADKRKLTGDMSGGAFIGYFRKLYDEWRKASDYLKEGKNLYNDVNSRVGTNTEVLFAPNGNVSPAAQAQNIRMRRNKVPVSHIQPNNANGYRLGFPHYSPYNKIPWQSFRIQQPMAKSADFKNMANGIKELAQAGKQWMGNAKDVAKGGVNTVKNNATDAYAKAKRYTYGNPNDMRVNPVPVKDPNVNPHYVKIAPAADTYTGPYARNAQQQQFNGVNFEPNVPRNVPAPASLIPTSPGKYNATGQYLKNMIYNGVDYGVGAFKLIGTGGASLIGSGLNKIPIVRRNTAKLGAVQHPTGHSKFTNMLGNGMASVADSMHMPKFVGNALRIEDGHTQLGTMYKRVTGKDIPIDPETGMVRYDLADPDGMQQTFEAFGSMGRSYMQPIIDSIKETAGNGIRSAWGLSEDQVKRNIASAASLDAQFNTNFGNGRRGLLNKYLHPDKLYGYVGTGASVGAGGYVGASLWNSISDKDALDAAGAYMHQQGFTPQAINDIHQGVVDTANNIDRYTNPLTRNAVENFPLLSAYSHKFTKGFPYLYKIVANPIDAWNMREERTNDAFGIGNSTAYADRKFQTQSDQIYTPKDQRKWMEDVYTIVGKNDPHNVHALRTLMNIDPSSNNTNSYNKIHAVGVSTSLPYMRNADEAGTKAYGDAAIQQAMSLEIPEDMFPELAIRQKYLRAIITGNKAEADAVRQMYMNAYIPGEQSATAPGVQGVAQQPVPAQAVN